MSVNTPAKQVLDDCLPTVLDADATTQELTTVRYHVEWARVRSELVMDLGYVSDGDQQQAAFFANRAVWMLDTLDERLDARAVTDLLAQFDLPEGGEIDFAF